MRIPARDSGSIWIWAMLSVGVGVVVFLGGTVVLVTRETRGAPSGEQAENSKVMRTSRHIWRSLFFFGMDLKYYERDRSKHQQEDDQHKSSQKLAIRIQLCDLIKRLSLGATEEIDQSGP
jgi:hypothetical protein